MNHLYKDQEIPCEVLARRTASAGMEVIHDCFESPPQPPPPPPSKEHVKLEEEPGDLLEKSWFFGNLLERKTRMSRCFSDPCCPSSKLKLSEEEMPVGGKSYEETYSSLKKLPQGERFASPGLMRTPSLPERSTHHAEGRNDIDKGSKSGLQPSSSNNLFRAPSLPTSMGREEIHDEESDFSMSKLIRQASLKSSDLLPPRRLPKAVPQSSSTPRNRQRRKQDSESIKTESPEGKMVRSHPICRTKLDRSSSDLLDELKGFKNLSFKWDSQDLGPCDTKTVVPGPNDKKEEKSSSSHDHGCQRQTSMDKRSEEDMKAQIKFWARAVASNVRQEC